MKQFGLILFVAGLISFSGTSCKKAIEAAQEQAIIDAITDGSWYVSKYKEAGNDSTTIFSGWSFVYYNNGTSKASKTGNSDVTGTWAGDAATWTFTATFTSSAPDPLPRLAGTWTVTRAVSTNKGSYAKTVNGIQYELELTKK